MAKLIIFFVLFFAAFHQIQAEPSAKDRANIRIDEAIKTITESFNENGRDLLTKLGDMKTSMNSINEEKHAKCVHNIVSFSVEAIHILLTNADKIELRHHTTIFKECTLLVQAINRFIKIVDFIELIQTLLHVAKFISDFKKQNEWTDEDVLMEPIRLLIIVVNYEIKVLHVKDEIDFEILGGVYNILRFEVILNSPHGISQRFLNICDQLMSNMVKGNSAVQSKKNTTEAIVYFVEVASVLLCRGQNAPSIMYIEHILTPELLIKRSKRLCDLIGGQTTIVDVDKAMNVIALIFNLYNTRSPYSDETQISCSAHPLALIRDHMKAGTNLRYVPAEAAVHYLNLIFQFLEAKENNRKGMSIEEIALVESFAWEAKLFVHNLHGVISHDELEKIRDSMVKLIKDLQKITPNFKNEFQVQFQYREDIGNIIISIDDIIPKNPDVSNKLFELY